MQKKGCGFNVATAAVANSPDTPISMKVPEQHHDHSNFQVKSDKKKKRTQNEL